MDTAGRILNTLPPQAAILLRLARLLEPEALAGAVAEELSRRIGGSLALARVHAEQSDAEAWRRDGQPAEAPGEARPALLEMPLIEDGEHVGSVAFRADEALHGRRRAAERALLEVALLAAAPARNAARHAAALALGMSDPLTGLTNRRGFERALARESAAARRYRRPLALLLADLDGFKLVNDTLGHPAGDAALGHFARTLVATARSADLVARLGGDEFAVLMPGTSTIEGARLAERLEAALGARSFVPPGSDAPMTLAASFGVADLAEAFGSPEELLRLADEALYAEKRSRRSSRSTHRRSALTLGIRPERERAPTLEGKHT